MQTTKIVYWEDEDGWLGYLQEFPDYWTQGDTLDDLEAHLRDLYIDERNLDRYPQGDGSGRGVKRTALIKTAGAKHGARQGDGFCGTNVPSAPCCLRAAARGRPATPC